MAPCQAIEKPLSMNRYGTKIEIIEMKQPIKKETIAFPGILLCLIKCMLATNAPVSMHGNMMFGRILMAMQVENPASDHAKKNFQLLWEYVLDFA